MSGNSSSKMYSKRHSNKSQKSSRLDLRSTISPLRSLSKSLNSLLTPRPLNSKLLWIDKTRMLTSIPSMNCYLKVSLNLMKQIPQPTNSLKKVETKNSTKCLNLTSSINFLGSSTMSNLPSFSSLKNSLLNPSQIKFQTCIELLYRMYRILI